MIRLPNQGRTYNLFFIMKVCYQRSDVILEVISEAFIEPDVAPPVAGDQVAEPHVGGLVGHYLRYSILVVRC